MSTAYEHGPGCTLGDNEKCDECKQRYGNTTSAAMKFAVKFKPWHPRRCRALLDENRFDTAAAALAHSEVMRSRMTVCCDFRIVKSSDGTQWRNATKADWSAR